VGASTTFDTSNSGVIVIAPNVLEIGGTVYGVGNFTGELANPVDDFAFEFDPTLASQSGQLNYLSYAIGSPPTPGGIAYSDVPETITAVPEASTWAMFLFGFGAIGIAIRRRRKSLAVQDYLTGGFRNAL
jgi:PEP-CTERM motif